MKEKSYNPKGFISALQDFHSGSSKYKKFQQDKRLTQNEKIILGCWELLGQNKFDEIIDLLGKQSSEIPFVEAQRLMLLGITYNNKTNFNQAVINLKKSIEILSRLSEKSALFTAYYNLYLASHNANDKNEMKKCLSQLEDFSLNTDKRKILFNQCYLNFALKSGDLKSAEKTIHLLNKLKHSMSSAMYITHLLTGFSLYVKMKDFKRCYEILNELKSKRSFQTGANYKYLRFMLDAIHGKKTKYLYSEYFAETPYILNQVMVIQKLEQGLISEAAQFWDQLKEKYSEHYLDDFIYKGDADLFSMALEMFRPKDEVALPSLELLEKEDAILVVLQKYTNGISKEDLYDIVWGKSVESKTDLNRLQVYISRLRSKGHCVVFRKSVYRLLGSNEGQVESIG